jgi:hypothetical protein
MFSSRNSRIILGASLAVAVGLGAVGVGMAASAAPSHQSSAHAPLPIAPAAHHTPVTPSPAPISPMHEKVPFTAQNVWAIAQPEYDPTLVHSPHYVPVPGSSAAVILNSGGFASEYTSAKDGNRLVLAVAKGTPGEFAAQEAVIARHGSRVTRFGPWNEVQAYQVGAHEFDVFADGYWISVSSNMFQTPQNAAPLIGAALQTIPQG